MTRILDERIKSLDEIRRLATSIELELFEPETNEKAIKSGFKAMLRVVRLAQLSIK